MMHGQAEFEERQRGLRGRAWGWFLVGAAALASFFALHEPRQQRRSVAVKHFVMPPMPVRSPLPQTLDLPPLPEIAPPPEVGLPGAMREMPPPEVTASETVSEPR